MDMTRRFVSAQINVLSDNECDITIATRNLALDDDVWVMEGGDLTRFAQHPVALWSHNPEHPVGNISKIVRTPEKITGRVTFAPPGTTRKSDETRGLVKSCVVTGVSAGIIVIRSEPLDPKNPRGGQLVTEWILMEVSFVSVPSDTKSGVTARAKGVRSVADEEWKVGTSRNLPVENSDAWDGGAAEESIFKWAGGDDFDGAKARKGFLFYNANKPKDRGSYRDPIAHVVDGRLTVPKGAIRAAASRLPQTDVPDDAKKTAEEVLAHYKEKAGMSDTEHAVVIAHKRALARATTAIVHKRGLYEVASLAYQLEQLGYAHAMAEWEAALEGDDSKVPEMLGEALIALGTAFKAMAEEEVDELLDGQGLIEVEDDDTEIEIVDRAYIAAGKTPRARAWRKAIVMLRAGKAMSGAAQNGMEDAQGNCERALKHSKALGDNHAAVGEQVDAMRSALAKASETHGKIGDALTAAKEKPDDAEKHIERAVKAHGALGDQLDAAASARSDMADRHEDVGDSHRALLRSLKAADRCVRSALDGAVAGTEDGDSTNVQKSDETAEDKGARSADFWKREVAKLKHRAA